MPKTYTEVEIIADEQLREHIVGILSQIGFEGFWEEGTVLRCYISRERWSSGMLDEIQNLVSSVQRSNSSTAPKISVKDIPERNWNEEWEKTIQPIHVTKRIVITPTWHEYTPLPEEIVLTIDPKMSFGTGYHETTRLVLRLMEKYVKRGINLLDIGTGTGVLAIAGIKLGARSATGVDNDEWSYNNATENVQLNGVQDSVQIVPGELDSVDSSGFDMILANIQRNVIEPLLPDMKSKLSPNGVVILSGLLNVDEEPMLGAFRDFGFNVLEMIKENEWIAFAVQPGSPAGDA